MSANLPKPLFSLLGLSLIERILLSAKEAGIREVIVVIGFLGERIKEYLGEGKRLGLKIEYINNKEWEKGNALSLMAAKPFIKQNFILLMADHLFSPSILKRLKKEKVKEGEGILVVDCQPHRYIDIPESTKVEIRNGKVLDIGKELKNWTGIDCGIFLLSPSIFEVFEQSIKRSRGSLSEGMRLLAKEGRLRTLGLEEGEFWIDIDTYKELKQAEKILCKNLIKPTDGPVSRLLNRPISIFLSRYLVKLNISPNSLSLFAFLGCALSAFFFSTGAYPNFIIAGILAQIFSILDGCDGEVARLTFRCSEYGAWFDAVLDRYADALIILGMVLGDWKLHMRPSVWTVGFFALLGSLMISYTAIKYDAILKEKKAKIKLRFGRDVRLFIIMLGGLTAQLFLTLLTLAFTTNLECIRRMFEMRGKEGSKNKSVSS